MVVAANLTGLAVGPLLAGLLAEYATVPLHLPYLIYLAALAAAALLVGFACETMDDPVRHIADVSLRPQIGVPSQIRGPFIAPAVAAFVIFALVGFYAALVPSLLQHVLHLSSKATAGAVVFELFIVAALTTIVSVRLESRTAMMSGLTLFIPSLALIALAQAHASLAMLLAGTALTGVAAALGYRGSLQVVNQIAPDEQRAGVTSSYYLTMFLGNSLPVIGIGVVSVIASPMTATIAFASVLGVLAIAALIAGAVYTGKS